jgi:ADP-ribose pyrophosphatase YjhB (NUDIX family)
VYACTLTPKYEQERDVLMLYSPIILERSFEELMASWRAGVTHGLHKYMLHSIELPAEPARLSDTAYTEMQLGSTYACADIVIVTKCSDGTFKVLLSKRGDGKPFAGIWWVHGGKLGAGELPEDVAQIRATRECGIGVSPHVLLGVYHTIAPDYMCNTIQPCYAAFVEHGRLRRVRVDRDHSEIRLFSVEELDGLPEHEKAWYPMYVAERAINAASEIF